MTLIPVYNKLGQQVSTINISDKLTFVSSRVSKGESGVYYKGVGSMYNTHSSLNANGHKVLGNSPIFYYGYVVQNEKMAGKFGILQEKFQPYFSDFCGSCGPKELRLLDNAKCEKSSVNVLDVVNYDKDNKQYYFKLEYDCNRVKYLQSGHPNKLFELMCYMVNEGWNFPWDKGSINDVSACGRISDIADMFQSKTLKHRLGTIYSLLYSLGKLNRHKYNEFLAANNYQHRNDMDYVFIALSILDSNGVNIDGLMPKRAENDYQIYKHVVGNHLIQGQNCAYVEDSKYGDAVKKMFIERVVK